MLIACLVLAVQGQVASPAPLDAEMVLRLLQGSTEFGPESDRTRVAIGVLRTYPESGEPEGCLADVTWIEEGPFGEEEELSGVASVERLDALEPGTMVLGQQGGWALVELFDQETWDGLQADIATARARAVEANALGDLRSLLLAQTVFAESAGAKVYAGELRCLARPRECLAVDSAPDTPLLEEGHLAPERGGYRFELGGIPSAGRGDGLVDAFTYIAVPLPGGSGRRSFCVDDSGRLCVVKDGSEPVVEGGRCAPSCETIGQ